MTAAGKRTDPLATLGFYFEVGGVQQALFSEFSGLEAEMEVFSYEEGGCNDYVHKLPGKIKFPNITLKRGVVPFAWDDLWLWFQDVINGKVERKDVSVVLYDQTRSEVKRWNFTRAYPVKWVGPAFKANENAISIETLELAHEGMSVSTAKKSE